MFLMAGCAAQQTEKVQKTPEPPEWVGETEEKQAQKQQQPQSELDQVIAKATEVIKVSPSSAKTYMRRGAAYYKKGELDKALADFSVVIYMKPYWDSAYLYRGNTLARQGKSNEALVDFDKAIELSPSSEMAYLQRALVQGKLGQLDRAIADFNQVLGINPQNWQARLSRGSAYDQKKDYAQAVEDYEKAIELKPEAYQAYNNLAWLLATCPQDPYRDGPRAVELAQKAYEINSHVYVLDTLAAAYAENGQFKDAIATQMRAIAKLREKNDLKLEPVMRNHLESYKKGKPWRQHGPL